VLIFVVVLSHVCSVVPAAAYDMGESSSISAGRRLFFGELPLVGAIVGHRQPLPAEVTVCANCHTGDSVPASGRSSGPPPLSRLSLSELRKRRGGPPSQFSEASFCRLLRTGIDPAYIVIARRMPRYIVSEEQCQNLWDYLMEDKK
jgi:hypothetical protein